LKSFDLRRVVSFTNSTGLFTLFVFSLNLKQFGKIFTAEKLLIHIYFKIVFTLLDFRSYLCLTAFLIKLYIYFLFRFLPSRASNAILRGTISGTTLCSLIKSSTRRVIEDQKGLKVNGTHQLLVCADNVNILEENMETIQENTEAVLR
jgi:hypothetical protein